MSEYEGLNCECGRVYVTKSFVSTCPSCGKTNWSAKGGLFAILIVIAIVIFVGLLFGPIAWAIYAMKDKLGKWNFLGASIAGLGLAFLFGEIYEYNEYPVLNWISYICNGAAFLLGGFMFFKTLKN